MSEDREQRRIKDKLLLNSIEQILNEESQDDTGGVTDLNHRFNQAQLARSNSACSSGVRRPIVQTTKVQKPVSKPSGFRFKHKSVA